MTVPAQPSVLIVIYWCSRGSAGHTTPSPPPAVFRASSQTHPTLQLTYTLIHIDLVSRMFLCIKCVCVCLTEFQHRCECDNRMQIWIYQNSSKNKRSKSNSGNLWSAKNEKHLAPWCVKAGAASAKTKVGHKLFPASGWVATGMQMFAGGMSPSAYFFSPSY